MLRQNILILTFSISVSLISLSDASAQIGILWQGNPTDNADVFLGAANMDNDPGEELLFVKEDTPARLYVLDGATGSVEWESGDWHYMAVFDATRSEKGPFADANGDGLADIVFLGKPMIGDPEKIYVLSYSGGGSAVGDDFPGFGLSPALGQNYPNPFNPSTTINFELTAPGRVQINIYDIRGQLVCSLENAEYLAGEYSTEWDGRDDRGRQSASGTYFFQLKVGEYTSTKKALLLK